MYLFDSNYLLYVLLPTLVLSLGAQFFLRTTMARWGKKPNNRQMTGSEVGEYLVRYSQLADVTFEGVPGALTDHYDPKTHTVRISQGNANTASVAAMAVVAHELGHAEQHQQHSPLIAMRSFLVPAMMVSPNIASGLILAGFIFGATGLIQLGILFFSVVVVFMILSLPVEIDASLRGLRMLRDTDLTMDVEDQQGARLVLTAAALTYVAAAIQAILQLLYYINLVSNRD